jgi:hypothetical protein
MTNVKNKTKEKVTNVPEVHPAILATMPPERQQALTSAEFPELMGELLPFAAFPYKPTQKHISFAVNETMSEEEKKQVVKDLENDSLVRFKVGTSKKELMIFASVIRGAASVKGIDPFVTLPDGKIGIRKGLNVKTAPKKFEFI